MDDNDTVPDDFDQFDATLSLKDPIEEYRKLIKERVKINAFVPTEMGYAIWDKISEGAREAIWKLIFDEPTPTQENLDLAAKFLKEHREDACFYSPWFYNTWIVDVRNELLKRGMLDFWKNVIVAKEMGPAWAKDSDMYDDMDDPEPVKYYNYAGCKAPWLKEDHEESTETALASNLKATEENKPLNITALIKELSLESPLDDYKQNIMAQTEINANDKEAYKKIFKQVKAYIWRLLFSEDVLTEDNREMAAALLVEYRRDACVYAPCEYNEWVVELRDELFKRKYFDVWQRIIVDKQLGLCWSKESDHFDDMEDAKPFQFYESGIDMTNQGRT